jgi:uncharacterized membrane protein YeaQ/YmgE (transglycosylase-associated protein family)
MHVVGFVLFGLLIGLLAHRLVSGKARGPWGVSMAVGTSGSLLGGFFGRPTGLYGDAEPTGFTMALLGAFVLVTLYHTLARRRRDAARLVPPIVVTKSAP